MEWRDVPGFPGYQVSERGRLRKSSGYVLCRQGKRYCLATGKGPVRKTPECMHVESPKNIDGPAGGCRADAGLPLEPLDGLARIPGVRGLRGPLGRRGGGLLPPRPLRGRLRPVVGHSVHLLCAPIALTGKNLGQRIAREGSRAKERGKEQHF